MKVLAVILVQGSRDVEAARRTVAGRAWLGVLADRLRRAHVVPRVVVVTDGCAGDLADLVTRGDVELIESERVHADVLGVLDGLDGAALCPVTQWFADPSRLDALAASPPAAGSHVVAPVLAGPQALSLWGGASLSILTPAGLMLASQGVPPDTWIVDARPVAAEPPDLHATAEDIDWACQVNQAIEGHDRYHVAASFDALRAGLPPARVRVWDGIGRAPGRILMLRCLREPMFSDMVRHVAGMPGAVIDIATSRAHAATTAALPSVGRVLCFEDDRFGPASLAGSFGRVLSEAEYDLCLLPRLEPSGHGLENALALPSAARARVTMWMDIRGQIGLVEGSPQGWEPAPARLAPHLEPLTYEVRAWRALERFSVPATLARLLPLVDEHLWCRALLDTPHGAIDHTTPMIYQWPVTQRLATHLAALDATRPDIATEFAARADAAYTRLVDQAAAAQPGVPPAAGSDASALEALDAEIAEILARRTEVP